MAPDSRSSRRRRSLPGIASGQGLLGSVVRFWHRSYAADYVSLAIITVGWCLIQIFVEPFHRMISLDNGSIQFPFATTERVPVVGAILCAGALPLIIIAVWAAIARPGSHAAHVTILGLLATLIITSFLTDIIKNAVGRPRPDLLSRCKPQKGTPEHSLVSFDVCTETSHHILHDGWRSFPSGHSSFAFGGLGYLSLFFAGQLHVFRPRSGLTCLLFSAAPLLAALMIAMSRLADYRHDVYDVTSGSILGLATAYFTYRRYYPSLYSIDCDIPYSRPSGYKAVSDARSVPDDEEALSSFGGRWEESHQEEYPMRETQSTRSDST